MMYQNKLAVAVKVDGKVLREQGEFVTLPFGSEYSIYLKNLNSTRAQVKVSVDGEDASGWLIIAPNTSLDLERFVKNLDRGNRFKFIERTDTIEKHRGIKAEDGLIRVEYKFEKLPPEVENVDVHIRKRYHYYNDYPYWPGTWPYYPNWPAQPYIWGGSWAGSDIDGSCGQSSNYLGTITNTSDSSFAGLQLQKSSQNVQCNSARIQINDAGITVPGSISEQKFYSTSGFDCHPSEVIVLKLRGEVGGKQVAAPVHVHKKLSCVTCGRNNKSSSQFCSQCGTCLIAG